MTSKHRICHENEPGISTTFRRKATVFAADAHRPGDVRSQTGASVVSGSLPIPVRFYSDIAARPRRKDVAGVLPNSSSREGPVAASEARRMPSCLAANHVSSGVALGPSV